MSDRFTIGPGDKLTSTIGFPDGLALRAGDTLHVDMTLLYQKDGSVDFAEICDWHVTRAYWPGRTRFPIEALEVE